MAEVDEICGRVIGACIEVHKALGPGLLEKVYHQCLCRELTLQRINYSSEIPVDLNYKGLLLDVTLRADLLVENLVIVEIKAVEKWNPLYNAQLISYLKLANKPAGLLVNFNVPIMVKGIQRVFNGM